MVSTATRGDQQTRRRGAYLDDVLQDFLVDGGFVACRLVVQFHDRLQGALSEGDIV